MLRSDAKHRVSKHEGINPRLFQQPVKVWLRPKSRLPFDAPHRHFFARWSNLDVAMGRVSQRGDQGGAAALALETTKIFGGNDRHFFAVLHGDMLRSYTTRKASRLCFIISRHVDQYNFLAGSTTRNFGPPDGAAPLRNFSPKPSARLRRAEACRRARKNPAPAERSDRRDRRRNRSRRSRSEKRHRSGNVRSASGSAS